MGYSMMHCVQVLWAVRGVAPGGGGRGFRALQASGTWAHGHGRLRRCQQVAAIPSAGEPGHRAAYSPCAPLWTARTPLAALLCPIPQLRLDTLLRSSALRPSGPGRLRCACACAVAEYCSPTLCFCLSLPVCPFPPQDLVVYEVPVRCFTADPSSGVPEEQRGTFAGMAAKVCGLAGCGLTTGCACTLKGMGGDSSGAPSRAWRQRCVG